MHVNHCMLIWVYTHDHTLVCVELGDSRFLALLPELSKYGTYDTYSSRAEEPNSLHFSLKSAKNSPQERSSEIRR